jgi:hypothetical protein
VNDVDQRSHVIQSIAIHGHDGLRAYTHQAEEVWERFHVDLDEALAAAAERETASSSS